jgi:tetratricopeptide (TPR) repeat protein
MKLAGDAQKQQDFNKALRLYKDAYDLFTRIDDVRGKINAGLSIARQYFYLDNPVETEKWLDRASRLIETGMRDMQGAKAVLSIEMAFAKDDYKAVIDIAENTAAHDMEREMEILCYAMVSKSRLKQNYEAEFKQVREGLTALRKKFEKGKLQDPEVLSLAYYYIGFIYGIQEKWEPALLHFKDAKTIDGKIDNAHGLAKDLYSIGRCYQKLGLSKKAAAAYAGAAEIFTLLKDTAMAEKAKKKEESLRKKE